MIIAQNMVLNNTFYYIFMVRFIYSSNKLFLESNIVLLNNFLI